MMHSNLNSFLILMVIMSSTLHTSAIEVRKSERALSNKNLLVAADAWPPFFIVYWGAHTLLNRTLPSQNLLYRKELNRTLLNQETDKTEFTKPYSAKPYSAKPVSGIC